MRTIKKKILTVISIIIIILLIIILPVILNNNYEKNNIKTFEEKTKLDINYLNIYNNYYIAKTKDQILVYNNKYEEIYKEDIDKTFNLNYDIIYKNGVLQYEETIVSNNKITYKYYDIYTGEKVDTIEIEAKQ